MATIQKITTGFVVQDFDEDTGKCIEQSFIAGDQVEWEDNSGDTGGAIDAPSNAEYFPFEMIQPKK
jgi:hypothetical protein